MGGRCFLCVTLLLRSVCTGANRAAGMLLWQTHTPARCMASDRGLQQNVLTRHTPALRRWLHSWRACTTRASSGRRSWCARRQCCGSGCASCAAGTRPSAWPCCTTASAPGTCRGRRASAPPPPPSAPHGLHLCTACLALTSHWSRCSACGKQRMQAHSMPLRCCEVFMRWRP
jgi:hypothetical protein